MGKISNGISNLVYNNDVELVKNSKRKAMDTFIIQAVVGTIFGALTGGVYLSGLLIYLGASDAIVSYVALLPSICGIFMIFCAPLVEKNQHRRNMVVLINCIVKVLISIIIFIPLFFTKATSVWFVLGTLFIAYTLNGINGLAINTWFVSLIPEKIKGRYFSIRQVLAVCVSIVLPVATGRLIDSIPDKYSGFLILFCVALVVGLIECFAFSKIEDVTLQTLNKKINIIDVFKIPLANKPFVIFTIRVALFYFFLYIGAAFTQIYMIKYLSLSYTYINSIGIIAAVLQIVIFYKFWGVINDRLGANFTVTIAMGLYTFDMFLWFFIGKSTVYFILPILQIVAAIEGAGFTVGVFTRRFEFAPEEGRAFYDSFFSCVLGVVLLISPICGTLLRDFCTQHNLFSFLEFGPFRFPYLVASIGLALVFVSNIRSIKKDDPNNVLFKKESYVYLKRFLVECFFQVIPSRKR